MILFSERTTYINVFKANFRPRLSVDDIGSIRRISDAWTMRFIGRNWMNYTDLLDNSEKRQIIGMLDKLNGKVIGPTDPMDNLRQRWNEIIGTSVAAITDSDNKKGR